MGNISFSEERTIHFNESDNVCEHLKEVISKTILKYLGAQGFRENERTSLRINHNHNTISFDFVTGDYYSPIEVVSVITEPLDPAVSNRCHPFHRLFSTLKRSLNI
jgi:hypothetical protein